jgi:hypothetical protein
MSNLISLSKAGQLGAVTITGDNQLHTINISGALYQVADSLGLWQYIPASVNYQLNLNNITISMLINMNSNNLFSSLNYSNHIRVINVYDSVSNISFGWNYLESLYASGRLGVVTSSDPSNIIQISDFSTSSLGVVGQIATGYLLQLNIPNTWLGSYGTTQPEVFLHALNQATHQGQTQLGNISINFTSNTWTYLSPSTLIIKEINDGLNSGLIGNVSGSNIYFDDRISLVTLAQEITNPILSNFLSQNVYFQPNWTDSYVNASVYASYLSSSFYSGFFNSSNSHAISLASQRIHLSDSFQNILSLIANPLFSFAVGSSFSSGGVTISVTDSASGSITLSAAQLVSVAPLLHYLSQYHSMNLVVTGSSDDFVSLNQATYTNLVGVPTEFQLFNLGINQQISLNGPINNLNLSYLKGVIIQSINSDSNGHTLISVVSGGTTFTISTLSNTSLNIDLSALENNSGSVLSINDVVSELSTIGSASTGTIKINNVSTLSDALALANISVVSKVSMIDTSASTFDLSTVEATSQLLQGFENSLAKINLSNGDITITNVMNLYDALAIANIANVSEIDKIAGGYTIHLTNMGLNSSNKIVVKNIDNTSDALSLYTNPNVSSIALALPTGTVLTVNTSDFITQFNNLNKFDSNSLQSLQVVNDNITILTILERSVLLNQLRTNQPYSLNEAAYEAGITDGTWSNIPSAINYQLNITCTASQAASYATNSKLGLGLNVEQYTIGNWYSNVSFFNTNNSNSQFTITKPTLDPSNFNYASTSIAPLNSSYRVTSYFTPETSGIYTFNLWTNKWASIYLGSSQQSTSSLESAAQGSQIAQSQVITQTLIAGQTYPIVIYYGLDGIQGKR